MSKHDPPIPQPAPRICLFCEKKANSPEHMWPKWMAPYFDRTSHDLSVETWTRIGFREHEEPGQRIRYGHPTTRTLKVVCKPCNNMWMSRMETAAKPHLKPMLLGTPVMLCADAQLALTQWITLKMMVWEHVDTTTAVFTRNQTLAFGKERAIPANLQIWVLCAKDGGYANISRSFTALFPRELFHTREITEAMKNTANTQTVLFGIGKLLIFFVHSHLPDLELGKNRQAFAKALWPPFRPTLRWPPMKSLTITDRRHLAMMLDRYLKRPGNIPV